MIEIAIILGILEGLTEFIPVSSTGHLIIVGHLLGFSGATADTFDIFIQLGAILAVVVLYFERFRGLLDFRPGQSGFRGINGIVKLLAVSLPALVLGALFHGAIKRYLFNSTTVAIALILGGLVMIWVESRKAKPARFKSPEELPTRTAFIIGVFQCLALWPGMSRSASTIVGGMLLGLERQLAAEFSFLAAVPVMCAAVGYDLLKSAGSLTSLDVLPFALGFITSFLVAVLSIRVFMRLLNSWTLKPFGYYRIALGALLLFLR